MFDQADPLGRLAEHARKPYPEQPSSFRHLVEHWQNAYDGPGRTDEHLSDDLADCKEQLADADQEALEYGLSPATRIHTHAQINARQARLTGWIKAIEAEQMRRKFAALDGKG
jgi:hypothetical protein